MHRNDIRGPCVALYESTDTIPIPTDCTPSVITPAGDSDSPSGVGLGPTGIALKIGRLSIWSSNSGKPSPARAQLTFESNFLSSSATGDTRFSGGNIQSWQVGQVYPAGAVSDGRFLA